MPIVPIRANGGLSLCLASKACRSPQEKLCHAFDVEIGKSKADAVWQMALMFL